jgi:uncharacterized protein YbjT (DUF2867 family)
MKIVIPGGTGQIGRILGRAFSSAVDEVVVVSRTANAGRLWRTLINTGASARCFARSSAETV